MEEQDEKQSIHNKAYVLNNLKVVAQTGSHAYTKLSSSSISDNLLNVYASKYPYIQNIDVSHNELKTIRSISQFKHLKWLNVSFNKLTEFDLSVEWDIHQNTGNKSLFGLYLSHNKIMKLGCLYQHIHIEILDLSHNELQFIDELKSLHLLKKLNIEHNNIKDLSPLNKLPIRELNASHNNIHEMDHISAQTIKICNVNHNNISNLECVQRFHHLTELYISENNISDFDALQNLTKLSLLRILDITGNPIKHESIECNKDLEYKILWILSNLESLNGQNVEPKSKIESQFKHSAFDDNLRFIKEYYTNDDRKFDDDQNEIPKENEYEFRYRLIEEGFAIYWEKFMIKFPNLSTRNIDLTDIYIGNTGLHSVCDSIAQCAHLKQLILRNCLSMKRWSDTKYKWPLQYLCDSLLIHNTLSLLDLSSCCIDAVNFEPIGDIIERCFCLRTLHLNDNKIGQHIIDETTSNVIIPCPAIKILTQSILKSDSLKTLWINHNEIDGLGAYFIGKCLQHEKCVLDELDISYNSFGKNGNGFEEIAKSIKTNHCLKSLDISHCIEDEDGSECMESVLHSFKENKDLESFNISGNILSQNAMKYLSSALQLNIDVKCFKMKDVIIDNESFHLIQSVLSNKNNLIELSMDIQSPQNIDIILKSLLSHSNLQSLYLSNIQKYTYHNASISPLESQIIETCPGLMILDLNNLYLSPTHIRQIIDALYKSNECLTNFNLSSSELDEECCKLLNKLCNKLQLKELNLSLCAINDDCSVLIKEFFRSNSVQNSMERLNMSNMKWNNNDPMVIFHELFDELCFEDDVTLNTKNRKFTLNLSQLPLYQDNIDHRFLSVLSKLCITTLVFDHFVIKSKRMEVTPIKLISKMLDCFAKNRYTISSLSILHDIDYLGDDDDLPLAPMIHNLNLQHISLPKINADVLKGILRNLRNCQLLRTVQVANDIDEDIMEVMLPESAKIDTPQIIGNQFLDICCKSMDHKLNQYVINIAYKKCCRTF